MLAPSGVQSSDRIGSHLQSQELVALEVRQPPSSLHLRSFPSHVFLCSSKYLILSLNRGRMRS